MREEPHRELLIDTAHHLFNQQGYQITEIDSILASSGISKATFKKYFPSKNDLILAVLIKRNEQLLENIEYQLETAKLAGEEHPVLSIFDFLHEYINAQNFSGCDFINACSEFKEEDHQIHQYAAYHKQKVQQLLQTYLRTEDDESKLEQSESIQLLMSGAIVSAQVKGNMNAAKTAKYTAKQLLSV